MSDPRQHELARPARMPAPELPVVIEAASDDGVLPIVARNLHRLTAGDHRAIMIEGATAQQFNKIRGNELQQDLVALAGRNLLLLHHANRIMAEFKSAALPAQVIKGPVFARRLYEHPNDRCFTDIDILVDPNAIAECCAILARLGYVQALSPNRGGSEHGEHKWLSTDSDIVLVEIQSSPPQQANLLSKSSNRAAHSGGVPLSASTSPAR